MTDEALGVSDVSKRFGAVCALSKVDLKVVQGEIVALIGRNGAGKTTLFSIVAGLCRPDTGRVHIKGIDIARHARQAKQYLGLASQDTAVYPSLSVRDNLRLFGELRGLRRALLSAEVDEVAEMLDVHRLLDRPAGALSGGEARRVHTALALICRPPVLLLDEPTAGVDVHTRARVIDTVKSLADEGTAICYSTHYFSEAEQLAVSVAILDEGRIKAQGSVQDLIAERGQGAVELVFDGAAPQRLFRAEPCSATKLRVATREPPAVVAARLLAELGEAADQLQAIELVNANLESIFLDITDEHGATLDRMPRTAGSS